MLKFLCIALPGWLTPLHDRRLRAVSCAILAAALACATTGTPAALAGDSGWMDESLPTPAVASNGQLTATSCASATSCIAVGVAHDRDGHEVSLAEGWNGKRWQGQRSVEPDGAVGSFLAGVACTSGNTCTAVGNVLSGDNHHRALVERWNGSEWQMQSAALPAGAADSYLSGVSCVSASACVAVGYFVNGAGQKLSLGEQWNGRDWAIESTPNADGVPDNELSAVSCTSASLCTAVGKSTIGFSPHALIARWNGVRWASQTAAAPDGASATTLSAVSCSTATACTAVGDFAAASTKAGGALAERWDGATWTVQPTPGTTLDVLSAVSCTALTACTAVGHTGFSEPLAEGWNGSTWAAQAIISPPGASLSTLAGVSCLSNVACMAVGSILDPIGDGTNLTLAEQWTGTRWDVLTTFNATGTTRNGLSGVSCANAGACTAVGYFFDSSGTQLALAEQWTEATGWQLESTPRPTGSTGSVLSGVSCTTPRNCTAVGVYGDATGNGLTLIEHWNGVRWQIQPSPNPVGAVGSGLSGVSCTAVGRPGPALDDTRNSCTAVGVSSDANGTASTLAERWDGTRWQIQSTPNPAGAFTVSLRSVSCPADRECMAVGTYVDNSFGFLTFAEHWNGASWDIETTPNRVATDGVNGQLDGGVSCPTTGDCTAVGQWSPAPAPHPGVTLAEQWNGGSWAVQSTADPAGVGGPNGTQNSPFTAVSCASPNDCTAVGNYDSGDANGDFLTLAEHWTGSRWVVQSTVTPTGAFYSVLNAVSCPTAHICMAVGESTRYNPITNTRGPAVGLAERYVRGDD